MAEGGGEGETNEASTYVHAQAPAETSRAMFLEETHPPPSCSAIGEASEPTTASTGNSPAQDMEERHPPPPMTGGRAKRRKCNLNESLADMECADASSSTHVSTDPISIGNIAIVEACSDRLALAVRHRDEHEEQGTRPDDDQERPQSSETATTDIAAQNSKPDTSLLCREADLEESSHKSVVNESVVDRLEQQRETVPESSPSSRTTGHDKRGSPILLRHSATNPLSYNEAPAGLPSKHREVVVATRAAPIHVTHVAPQPPYCAIRPAFAAEKRRVHFSHVTIRNYKTTIGDNPSCSSGPPLMLDWGYTEEDGDGNYLGRVPIGLFELYGHSSPNQAASHGRKLSLMLMNATQRSARLVEAGYSVGDIKNAMEGLRREKFRRSPGSSKALEPWFQFQELWIFQIEPFLIKQLRKNEDEVHQHKTERQIRKVRHEHMSQSQGRSQQSISMMPREDPGSDEFDDDKGIGVDLEEGCLDSQEPSVQVFIEGMDELAVVSYSQHSTSPYLSCSGGTINVIDEDEALNESIKATSESSYGIEVDRKQHDKAVEIKLNSFRRPHMRAFHASWFSFFVAFFCWFSITPLLSEIKVSLNLTNQQLWVSSLTGTAGTVLMRILMGPACDKFGSRICMACILITAAIPTACQGFVETSTGLSVVRLFLGIAGTSFVACQYWTSDMFTREVAGTANAVAAGWGNLGGGVAQLIMGSALFPLFQWIYDSTDSDSENEGGKTSSELAWRTVFVVPALVAIVTGIAILVYCDDSPLGSYRDLIQKERLLVVDPYESLRKAAWNRNVWVLAIQYACCFGVEVTMTNATALYYKDEFGQSTVSAAAISSVFGLMNLFARGLGGWGSDWSQNAAGVRGRLAWQMVTLTLEGAMICIFASMDTLGSSIVALIFLSCMVQSAEGSTFGIVPYVDRRFTGSVVGIVGSGGTMGSAIFSIVFVNFSYKTSFVVMGVAAALSAILSCFINTQKIAQLQELLHMEIDHGNETAEPNQTQPERDANGSANPDTRPERDAVILDTDASALRLSPQEDRQM